MLLAEDARALGAFLYEKEREQDRLHGRVLELELALLSAGIELPPGDGWSMVELYRTLRGIAEWTERLLRGDESVRPDLEELVSRVSGMAPTCREGDHGTA